MVTSVLLISAALRELTFRVIGKLKAKLPLPEVLKNVIEASRKYFFAPITRGTGLLLTYLYILSVYINKGEEFFISVVLPELVEPVNYASLILRKCYTNSQTAIITSAALIFVVFYFILSIF
ncbi:MAG: hypothetical protein ABI543_10135 [Ignavibacteria bacterium]